MEIVDVHAVFGGMIAEVIGGAVGKAGLHASACHKQRVAVGVMVAAVPAFGDRRATELARPDHQRVFQVGRAL